MLQLVSNSNLRCSTITMFRKIFARWEPSQQLLREVEKSDEKLQSVDLKRINKLILEKGADVNYVDKKTKWRPLGIACRNGNFDIVQLFLDHGASVNAARDEDYAKRIPGTTPLCIASGYGHIKIVRLLLQKNARVKSANTNPLVSAIYGGHIDIVRLLVEQDAPIDCTLSGPTPLYIASQQGYSQIVQVLLDKGANVNRGGNYSGSPLCIASENGHLQVVEKLSEYGADMCKTDNLGYTPLEIANQKGHSRISELLIREEEVRKDKSKKYSFLKSFGGHSTATRRLLQEVGIKNNPHYKKVKELIVKEGADVNCTATNKWTPLHWACSEGHYDIVKLLLDNGAATDRRVEGRDTPLFKACRNGHLKIVQLLLDKNARVDPANRWGCQSRTPLHWACLEGKIDLVKVLVRYGANVNKPANNNGSNTPLFMAIQKGHLDIVEVLLKNGATRTITIEGMYFNDMNEKMPDHTIDATDEAIANGHTGIAELLCQYE